MKLRIPHRTLAAATRAAASVLPTRSLVPALAGLLVEADGEHLTLSGSDLDTTVRQTVAADVAEPGRAVVPGRVLADICGALPAGDVELVLDGAELHLTGGPASFTIATVPVAEYPKLPALPAASGTAPGDLLAQAVTHAAATADPTAVGSMAALAGVHLQPDGDRLRVTATDRYCVAQHWVPWDAAGPAEAATFPARSITAAVKALADTDVTLSLPPGATGGLAGPGHQVVIRGIDAVFPPIDKLIPTEFAAVAALDAAELTATVKRLALVLDDKSPLLLEFQDDRLTVATGAGATARGAERIPAALDGAERFRIAYRPAYLLAALAPLTGQAHINLVTPTRSSLIHDSGDASAYRALVMPVKNEWARHQPRG